MSPLFSLELFIAAFAGGAVGAAIGALPSFVFTGFMVIVGEALSIVRRHAVTDGGVPAVTDLIAFGVVFGPHVSFAGGAAAAAFAAKRGLFSTPEDPFNAKDILTGLGTRPDVLVVGGLFGMLGHAILIGSLTIEGPWDPVAMALVISALFHRLVFGYEVFGNASKQDLLAVSPTRAWLPYMTEWSHVTAIGIVAGILGGYLVYVTGSVFLGFGISAASLLFMIAGTKRIPVTHHMTLPASTAVMAAAGLSIGDLSPALFATRIDLTHALLIGGVFGGIGALFGELIQRLWYQPASTHLDPPAASIVMSTFVIALLSIGGIFETAGWVPHP